MRPLVFAVALACGSAHAIDLPVGSSRDGRIQRANYHPDDVVKISLANGIITRIILNEDETVTGVYTGYSDGYEITQTASAVTVQPMEVLAGETWVSPDEQWATNLEVETTKRLYSFDLTIDNPPAYRVQFRYPAEDEATRISTAKAEQAEAIRAQPRLARVANLDYYMVVGKRSESIAPLTTFDDGSHTFITFAKHGGMPSVYLDDSESIADVDIESSRPNTIRVKSLARKITLRKGRQAVVITNRAFPQD